MIRVIALLTNNCLVVLAPMGKKNFSSFISSGGSWGSAPLRQEEEREYLTKFLNGDGALLDFRSTNDLTPHNVRARLDPQHYGTWQPLTTGTILQGGVTPLRRASQPHIEGVVGHNMVVGGSHTVEIPMYISLPQGSSTRLYRAVELEAKI